MQLLKHEGVRKYASNTLWLFVENVLRLVSGVIIGVWFTRYLGPEKYGVISYALAFVAVFSSIAKVGLDSIVIRELVNHPEKKSLYLGTTFWLKIIGGLFTFTIITIFSYFSANSASDNLYILIISIGLLFQSYEVIDFYYQSQVKSKYVSIAKIFQLLLSGIIKIYLIYIRADLLFFVLVYLFEQIALAISLAYIYHSQKHESFYTNFDQKIFHHLIMESWPVIVVGIAITIQSKLDQVILGSLLGSIQLGYYALAVSLIEIISFVPMIINSSITPAIINAKKRSSDEYIKRLQYYYSAMFVFSLIIALPIFFFGKSITTLIYGAEFSMAGIVFSILALRIFFANMGVARSQFIVNEKLLKFNLLTTILGASVSVGMNYYLIPIYGVYGAVIASYISFFVSTFLIDLFYKKTRDNLLLMFRGILYSYQVFTKSILS